VTAGAGLSGQHPVSPKSVLGARDRLTRLVGAVATSPRCRSPVPDRLSSGPCCGGGSVLVPMPATRATSRCLLATPWSGHGASRRPGVPAQARLRTPGDRSLQDARANWLVEAIALTAHEPTRPGTLRDVEQAASELLRTVVTYTLGDAGSSLPPAPVRNPVRTFSRDTIVAQ
jgi:hypothetical protein